MWRVNSVNICVNRDDNTEEEKYPHRAIVTFSDNIGSHNVRFLPVYVAYRRFSSLQCLIMGRLRAFYVNRTFYYAGKVYELSLI